MIRLEWLLTSREVLKRPLVAVLTPTMSDAAIRAAFQNLHDSVLTLSEPGLNLFAQPKTHPSQHQSTIRWLVSRALGARPAT
jgi:hypothetical protein